MSLKPPQFLLTAFNCPHCHAYAQMAWDDLKYFSNIEGWLSGNVKIAVCSHCNKSSYWHVIKQLNGHVTYGMMLYPRSSPAPIAHLEMPTEVLADFNEARNIVLESPRGSAALLRLCVQKLCQHLGESGKNINENIGSLVKKGLSVEIQQSLDILRVVGNNSVHPGELSSDDIQEVALTLFELVNHIVEERISRPKKLSNLFNNLPPKALIGIERRDEEK